MVRDELSCLENNNSAGTRCQADKTDFTKAAVELLLDLIDEHRAVINSSSRDTATTDAKKHAWSQIETLLVCHARQWR